MFKIPFLSRLFEKKAPVKAKTPDEKEAPAEKKAVSAKPQPSNELQLPAAFVLDGDCKVEYAHYGKTLSDVPDAGTLAKLLAK